MQYGEPYHSFTLDITWPDLPYKAVATGTLVVNMRVQIQHAYTTISAVTIRIEVSAPYDGNGPEVLLAGTTYRPSISGRWTADGLAMTAYCRESTSKKLPTVLATVAEAVRVAILARYPTVRSVLECLLTQREGHLTDYTNDLHTAIHLYRDTGELTFHNSYYIGSYITDIETLRAALGFLAEKGR